MLRWQLRIENFSRSLLLCVWYARDSQSRTHSFLRPPSPSPRVSASCSWPYFGRTEQQLQIEYKYYYNFVRFPCGFRENVEHTQRLLLVYILGWAVSDERILLRAYIRWNKKNGFFYWDDSLFFSIYTCMCRHLFLVRIETALIANTSNKNKHPPRILEEYYYCTLINNNCICSQPARVHSFVWSF